MIADGAGLVRPAEPELTTLMPCLNEAEKRSSSAPLVGEKL
jgi:hypothetical protein